MPKAAAHVSSINADNIGIHVHYSVAVDTGLMFSSSARLNISLTLAQLLTGARNRIVADCADKGITITASDVVIFGAPS